MAQDPTYPQAHNHFPAERREKFGRHATAYRDGRPGYPKAVYRHLQNQCGLGPGCRVVEVGPASGQATAELLDAGAQVTAIEVAPAFAEMLTARFAGADLDVRVGLFEEVPLESGSFDLLAAATSFHWINAADGLAVAARVLRPGGWLALWWTCFGDPDQPDPLHEELKPILHRHAPHLIDDGNAGVAVQPYALDHAARSADVAEAGAFTPLSQLLIPWTARHTPDGARRLFASFSPFMALLETTRETVLDEIADLVSNRFGGLVERACIAALYYAQRT